jgi:hypothetical protein
MASGPIQDVSFGTALSISLNSYYDVLKFYLGGFGANEYLQLKLFADTIDISAKDYPWYSQTNLLQCADQAIEPSPTTDSVTVTAVTLHAVYEEFLSQLVTYVVIANNTPDDQKTIQDLRLHVDALRQQHLAWVLQDHAGWVSYANATNQSAGNISGELDWDSQYGHGAEIVEISKEIAVAQFQVDKLLDKQYGEPEDIKIIQAHKDFYDPSMFMGYPIGVDSGYDDQKLFSQGYLATKTDSARFIWSQVIGFDKSLDDMQNKPQGAITGHFDSSTATSTTISSDWGGSFSASYAFISVSASASEHTSIQDDFSKATSIDISSAASYKVALRFPHWFHAELFSCKRVVENIHDFAAFFGPKGSLLYYPTEIACVRGFSIAFHSSQNWTYDYDHKFSAQAGGGFNVFGFGFGGSGSYTNEQKQHTVSTSTTNLTIADDASTIRFVGYVLAKNTVYQDAISTRSSKALGKVVTDAITKSGRGLAPKPSGNGKTKKSTK